MTHLRRTVLAALAVALAVADRSDKHGRDAVVVAVHKVPGTPVGEFLGEGFVADYEPHAGDTPAANPCFTGEGSARPRS